MEHLSVSDQNKLHLLLAERHKLIGDGKIKEAKQLEANEPLLQQWSQAAQLENNVKKLLGLKR